MDPMGVGPILSVALSRLQGHIRLCPHPATPEWPFFGDFMTALSLFHTVSSMDFSGPCRGW